MKKLDKQDWYIWGRWVQPPLSGAFWSRWIEAISLNEIFPNVKTEPILFLDGHTLFSTETTGSFLSLANNLFDQKSFKEQLGKLDEVGKKCEESHLSLLDTKNTPVILPKDEYVEKLFYSYKELLGPWVGASMLSNALEMVIKEKGVASTEEEMFSKVKYYWRQTLLEKQAEEVKDMASILADKHPGLEYKSINMDLINEDQAVSKKFKSHLEYFAWFGTHHWVGEGLNESKLLDEIKSSFKRLGSYEPEPTPLSDPNNEDLWRLLAGCIYWRTHAAEVTVKVVFHSRPILCELAKDWGLSYDELLLLSSREISSAIKDGGSKIDLPKNFNERRKAYGANIDDNFEESIITGNSLERLVSQVIEVVPKDLKEIKGVVASRRGLVKGRVKVLITPEDVYKMEEGDILVAPETAPDYVPAMKKSAAIVTESGGVTSHAAIISRELKKPCIIGTKIATQVLKDGDVVEVDSDTGIIKIL